MLNGVRFRRVFALACIFVLAPTLTLAQSELRITGQVYNSETCTGIGQLVIKVTPPAASKSQSVQITNTDAQGDFQVQVPELADYYLAIFDGVDQVYGRVISLGSQNPLAIGLKPTGSSLTNAGGQDCRQLGKLKNITPVALALSSDGHLFALDIHGLILRYSTASPVSPPREVARFNSAWQVIDMALGHFGGQEHLFVTLIKGNVGQVMRYSALGHFEGNLFQSAALGGLCVDHSNGDVYVSEPRTGQVYAQHFSDKAFGRPFFRFVEAPAIDPMTLGGQILYVGELTRGMIDSLELNTKVSHTIAYDIGTPSALAFDDSSKKLFVADRSGAKVWMISVSPNANKPVVFVDGGPLKEPSAIAVAPDGSLWIGDQSSHAIFHYSSHAQLIRTIK